MKLFLLATLSFTNLSAAETPTDWLVGFRQKRAEMMKLIPSAIQSKLAAEQADFTPLPVTDTPNEGVAVGDFNCDGKPDYAITGLNKDSASAKALLAAKATPAQIAAAQAELKTYAWDRAAEVRVALSSAKGLLWRIDKGSYISNSGQDPTGCASSPSYEAMKLLKKDGCEFLSLGCCEKDGRYLIFKRDSIEVRVTDGC